MDGPDGSRLEALELPPAACAVTMLTLVHGWPEDARRWLSGVLAHSGEQDFEGVIVDNAGDAQVSEWLDAARG